MKLNPGDIFEVKLNKGKRYFQFLYKDDEYMAGHLIRAFTFLSKVEEQPGLDDIIKSPIDFYTYTRVIEGTKKKLWERIGNRKIEDNFTPPVFRQTNDVFSLVPKSENLATKFISESYPKNIKSCPSPVFSRLTQSYAG
jgi:hypothetical protein